MRSVLFLALALQLAAPAIAGEPASVVGLKIGDGRSFTYQHDPSQPVLSPKFVQFAISSEGGPTIRTMGDPILYVGDIKLGMWPSKSLTYKLAGGMEVTGHATLAQGTVNELEIYRTDGTMLRITNMSFGKPIFEEKGKIATWIYKKLVRQSTPVLDLTDVK